MATKKSTTKAKGTTKTEEVKRKSNLKELFVLWKNTGKKSKKTYFSGYISSEDYESAKLRGFRNMNKQNPKEPDLRVYEVDGEGEIIKESEISLWVNATNKGVKYLSGKFGNERIVGFFSNSDNEKAPDIRVYISEPLEDQNEPEEDNDLPF